MWFFPFYCVVVREGKVIDFACSPAKANSACVAQGQYLDAVTAWNIKIPFVTADFPLTYLLTPAGWIYLFSYLFIKQI